MSRWRRWVFEIRAPADEFVALVQDRLARRGIRVEGAEHFDFVARGFGARAYAKISWADDGLEMVVKLKSGLFASPAALERMLLDAGRDAQAKLTFDVAEPERRPT